MKRDRRYLVGIGATAFILIVALVAIASTGCTSTNASNEPLRLTEADNGKAFTVKTGDLIEVAIAGNPTTGFTWAPVMGDKDIALLELVGEPAYAADATDGTIVGSGGIYTITFKATAVGEATIDLVYSRSWEVAAPIQTFQATVTIE
jgi:inhibitor of cysteine peptidase